MDLIICAVNWVPQSLGNPETIPQAGIIFSNSHLPTDKAVALLQRKQYRSLSKYIYLFEMIEFWESPIAIPQNVL